MTTVEDEVLELDANERHDLLFFLALSRPEVLAEALAAWREQQM